MANKITNVSALEMAIKALSSVDGFSAEALEKLGNIKTSYEKKSKAERKPTQTQLDNERIKVTILEIMADSKPRSVSDVVKALDNAYSNQKISALMNALVESNALAKSLDKRKALFVKA